MESETKHSVRTEACYEVECALRQEIHSKTGEILKLECLNDKQCREIERLNTQMKILLETPDISDVYPSLDLFQYIKELIVQSSQNAPGKTHKANVDDVDLDYVKSALKYVIPGLFDPYAFLSMYEKHRVTSQESYMFDHLKDLLLKLSRENEDTPINPDEIDFKFVDDACRYCFPVLFDKYAILDQDGINDQKDLYTLLSEDDKHKIELADSILHKFGIGTMVKYEELVERGDIDIDILDRRGL